MKLIEVNLMNFSQAPTEIDQKIIPNGGTVYMFLKRAMDIVCSLIALIILSPIFLVSAIAIKIEDGGKVIFSQNRVGKDENIFKMYKFRSMCSDAEEMLQDLQEQNEMDGLAFKIAKDPRITKVGAFIRKTSIDELPQLINILTGDMSIVGPRPPLESEVANYNDYQRQRLLVKPGLTCFWQCSGRSDMSFDDWMDSDIYYIQNRSLWLDIKLILKTIPAVFKSIGAY